ncbi:MAG: hypothetical protein WC263_00330 [Candidatus Micrarchaeia archaeon]|jgi:hypothetical protein
MGAVECGGVDYTTYCGEITLSHRGGAVRFGQAKGFDEEFALKEKQKIADGDRITTGRKSFITIMGHPQGGAMQRVCAYPESEFTLRTRDWEATVKGERRKGREISHLSLVKGAFSVHPASAGVEIPMVKLEDRHTAKEGQFNYIIDIVQGMTVVVPGCTMLVSGGGRSHEAKPWFGMLGMTEVMVTGSGIFEKKTEVDARVSVLAQYAGFSLSMGGMVSGPESMMEYSARKNRDARAKGEEALKGMPAEADLEKMQKEGKVSAAQAEMSRAMAKAMKASGGAGSPAFGMNMLANMDFSKLKDMPGITPEQRKQLEEGLPQMMKMQKEFAESGQMAKLTAQANLSEKYMEIAAGDPVAKKRMAKAQSDLQARLDAYELPPYPAPKEWARVK